jgi:hypothetical protein
LNCCSDEYINNISERLSLYSELGTKKWRRVKAFPNKIDWPFWAYATKSDCFNE